MLDDPPDYIVLMQPGAFQRWPGFPHTLLLVPEGRDAASVLNESGVFAMYLIEPGATGETLNSPALAAYLAGKVPVRLCARRARDLRPFLRRAEALRARGYRVEVVR